MFFVKFNQRLTAVILCITEVVTEKILYRKFQCHNVFLAHFTTNAIESLIDRVARDG